MVFRTDRRVSRWVYYTAGDWLIGGVTMVLTAHLVAAPLVAYHFGLASPYAPLLSVLVFPLVVAVLIPGYVSMGLAWVTPNLSYAVGRLAGSAAEALSWAVNATSQLPGLNFQLRPVGIFWVLLCYGALGCVLVSRRIRFGRTLAAGSILVLLGTTAYTQRAAPAPKLAELNVLAIGAGQCALLRTPAGATYIFDAGTRSGFDAYQRVLAPFIRARRLGTPTVAFVSHANTDHYNALMGFLKEASLDRVYLNDYFGRGPYRNQPQPIPEEMQLLGELIGRDVELLRLRAGVKLSLDSRTAVEVLWPPADRRTDLTVNDTSLVLRITCDGQSVLLTGDLDELGQSVLAAAGSTIAADVLVMPHHGGWEKSLPEFLRAVGPSVVLVSNSFEPRCPVRGGDEAAALYGRMRTAYRYYSTPRNGWIQVRFGAGRFDVKTMR